MGKHQTDAALPQPQRVWFVQVEWAVAIDTIVCLCLCLFLCLCGFQVGENL